MYVLFPHLSLPAARDSLGDTEAAARSLISALSVDAPTQASEIAELSTLASKVLSSLDGDKVSALVDYEYKCYIDS